MSTSDVVWPVAPRHAPRHVWAHLRVASLPNLGQYKTLQKLLFLLLQILTISQRSAATRALSSRLGMYNIG